MNTTVDLSQILSLFPIFALLIAGIIPIAFKSIAGREQRSSASFLQALIGLGLAGGWIAVTNFDESKFIFENALLIDGASSFAQLICILGSTMVLLFSKDNINTRGPQFSEYVFLVMMSTIGMMTLIWANDLLVTFIGLETISLSLYVLIACSHEQTLAKEAAFKYFILGSFASALFLYGIAFIYGNTGTTLLSNLNNVSIEGFNNNKLLAIGWMLVVVGFSFKVALFPFHTWSPDVYQGASTPMTAFMATSVKTATFFAFMRFLMSRGFASVPESLMVLQWIAVLTILVGNIAAIKQSNLKRMLAYSSVAHSGYAFLALMVVGNGNFIDGVSSLLFYLITYTLMNLGAFAVVAMFEKYEETSVSVEDLKGLSQRHPFLAASFAIFLLSLAGIPPTAGFFAKLYVFSTAINEGYVWLAIWGVIGSVISVYYYLRPIVVMYMAPGELEQPPLNYLSHVTVVAVTAVAVLLVGIFSSPIFRLVSSSVKSFVQQQVGL